MSNDFKSIHEFDFTLICNYFKALKRQGPGSPEVTQKAVSFINELSDKARIAGRLAVAQAVRQWH